MSASLATHQLIRPETLAHSGSLLWSTGTGETVWATLCAAATGDLTSIRRLLAEDPNLARCNHEYRTPLEMAVRRGHLQVVEYLLDHGALFFDRAVEAAAERGFDDVARFLEARLNRAGFSSRGSVVGRAIQDRDIARVRQLLDAEPDLLHTGDERSNQPIHWAVMSRQPDIIAELLARGADINARRYDGARPIQLCNGDYNYRGWSDVPEETAATPVDILELLRKHGGECDISTASRIGDIERARELLAGDPSLANRVSEYVTYYACAGAPLRNAAAGGHIEIVKLLLEHGADPNLREEGIAPFGYALHCAVCNEHPEVVRLLLAHGAHANVPIESSADTLSNAIGRKDEAMIELLCSHGAARSVELLGYHGDVRVAAAVFAANPAMADDPHGLMYAAEQGHEAFVRLMLQYQPDLPKRIGVVGKTRELTELLFDHGMDPSHPNWLRITQLHQLARRGDIENARLFIERGADLNARDEDLFATPLAWAARAGKKEMVEFLLARGAKVSLPDDLPWATPMAMAEWHGHADVVEMIRIGSRSV